MNVQNKAQAIINAITIKRLTLIFFILVLPTIFAPYHSDDFFHLLLLSENSPITRNDASLWGLFSFVDQLPLHREQLLQYGVLPWFAADDFHFRFFRPLTEITHWIDFQMFGINPLPAHLQSIGWFLLLSGIIYKLVKRMFPGQAMMPLLALAIFMLDGQHVATIGWIANRNALVAAFFGFSSLYCHFLWRETGQKCYFFWALLALVLALLSGEAALAMASYLFFYALIIDQQGSKKGIINILPYFFLMAIWFYFYVYYGFGANTSAGLYLNPLIDTSEYISAILYRVPIYFTAGILPIPAGLSWGGGVVYAWIPILFYIFSLAVILLFHKVFNRTIRQDKRLMFLFLASIFALLPVCATMAQDRLSLFQTAGFDVVIAALILNFASNKNTNKIYIVSVLVGIHLIISPLHLLAGSAYIHWAAKNIAENALSINQAGLKDKDLICFQVPIGEAVSVMGIREVAGRDNPKVFFWLSNDEGDLVVTVINSHDIFIEKKTGFANGFESAFRSVKKRPFEMGEKMVVPVGIIEIENINTQNFPDKITMHFNKPLVNKSLLFYTFKNGQYEQVRLPDVGQSIRFN